MNYFKKSLKRRALRKTVEIKAALDAYIQPFKEMPSESDIGKDNADRINAHDLFSLYTADIIKKDIIYAR